MLKILKEYKIPNASLIPIKIKDLLFKIPKNFNTCINKDIENKKEVGEHYFNRANTLLEIGRLSESKNDYNKCIEIKDGYEDFARLAIEKINKNPLNGKF